MLAFWIGRLDDQIDETRGNSDVFWRDRPTGDELLRLANDQTATVMRGLGDRERIEGNRLFGQGTIAILVDGAGTKNADVDPEAAIEHEFLAVDVLDSDVVRRVVTGGLVDFARLDPGIDELMQANTRQVSRPAGGN